MAVLLCLASPNLLASSTSDVAPVAVPIQDISHLATLLSQADVVVLGEVHDNADHHRAQAALIQALAPRAVVWEMITQAQAETLTAEVLSDAGKTARTLDWPNSGWPDFALYAPVFQAARNAVHFGALVSRAESQQALGQGVATFFGPDAARFGLDQPLPEAQQKAREADQLVNHCNAMPAEMLPMLVDFQRLRDASLAAAVERALGNAMGTKADAPEASVAEVRGPVVVITGNGHARIDRGLAVYLSKAVPGLVIRSLGQMEAGQISGEFDLLLDAAAVERPDPCLAFSKSE